MHGKVDEIHHSQEHMIFNGLQTPFEATRYHSLYRSNNPTKLTCSHCKVRDKTIMAIMHHELPIFGLQFHPESIKTACGKQILNNFLNILV